MLCGACKGSTGLFYIDQAEDGVECICENCGAKHKFYGELHKYALTREASE